MNWIILFLSIGLLIYLGNMAGKRISEGSETGFLVADRTLGPFVLAGTVVATGFSGWAFLGAPGSAFKYGSTELLGNFLFAPAMVVAVLFFGRYLRNRAEKIGSNTIPEFVVNLHCEDQHSTMARTLRAVVSAGMFIFLTIFLTAQIRAMGALGSQWLGIDPMLAAILLLAIVAVYTLWGGLLAVAWTDTFMVVGMSLAAVYASIQIFTDIPVGEFVLQLEAIDTTLIHPTTPEPYGSANSPMVAIFLVFVYALVFSTALPYMSVRFLAMKDGISLAKTGLYTAILSCVLSIVPIIGMYVRIKNPDIAKPDDAMLWYLANVPPALLGSIITLFILFAMKSTANSILHTLSTALSHDMRIAMQGEKKLGNGVALKLNRVFVIIVSVIAFVFTFFLPQDMLSFLGIFSTGALMASLSGVLLGSMFFRGSAISALCSMIGGALATVLLLKPQFFPISTELVEKIGSSVGWVEGPLYGVAVSIILYIAVGLVTRSKAA